MAVNIYSTPPTDCSTIQYSSIGCSANIARTRVRTNHAKYTRHEPTSRHSSRKRRVAPRKTVPAFRTRTSASRSRTHSLSRSPSGLSSSSSSFCGRRQRAPSTLLHYRHKPPPPPPTPPPPSLLLTPPPHFSLVCMAVCSVCVFLYSPCAQLFTKTIYIHATHEKIAASVCVCVCHKQRIHLYIEDTFAYYIIKVCLCKANCVWRTVVCKLIYTHNYTTHRTHTRTLRTHLFIVSPTPSSPRALSL